MDVNAMRTLGDVVGDIRAIADEQSAKAVSEKYDEEKFADVSKRFM